MGFHSVSIRKLSQYMFITSLSYSKAELLKYIFTNQFIKDVFFAIILVFTVKALIIVLLGVDNIANIHTYIFAAIESSPLLLYMEGYPGIGGGRGPNQEPSNVPQDGNTNNNPRIQRTN
jgi:hypothetical protein